MEAKTVSRIICVIMVISLLNSALAACSQIVPQNSPLPAEAAKEPSLEGPGWKQDTSPVTLSWYLNFSWFPNKWGVDITSKYITEKTGVSIDFVVPTGNESEKLSTMIASDSLPDMVTLPWWEDGVKKMIDMGLVYPLNKLADQYDPYFYSAADKARLNWYTQPDGNVYCYPNASYSPDSYKNNKLPSNQTFVVRKDIYEAIGKPDMRTPENFLKALKDAKEKYPEINGQPIIPLGLNEFGADGCYSLEEYLLNFLALPREINGKYHEIRGGFMSDEYVRWLKVMRKANEMGLISKDVFVDRREQIQEKISQGRYFAMIFQRSDFQPQQSILYQKNPDSVYIAVDTMSNSSGDAPRLAGMGIAGWTVTFITKNNPSPDRSIKFMSYWLSEEGQKDFYLGKKGVTWDTIDGRDQFFPDVWQLINTDRSAFDKKYGAAETFWMLMDNPMFETKWQPEDMEPHKQLKEWTLGKTHSYAQYDNVNPPSGTPEGIIRGKVNLRWGQILPKLILAKSDAEFDIIWNSFQEEKQKLGYEAVRDYQQKKVEENKKKLGIE